MLVFVPVLSIMRMLSPAGTDSHSIGASADFIGARTLLSDLVVETWVTDIYSAAIIGPVAKVSMVKISKNNMAWQCMYVRTFRRGSSPCSTVACTRLRCLEMMLSLFRSEVGQAEPRLHTRWRWDCSGASSKQKSCKKICELHCFWFVFVLLFCLGLRWLQVKMTAGFLSTVKSSYKRTWLTSQVVGRLEAYILHRRQLSP